MRFHSYLDLVLLMAQSARVRTIISSQQLQVYVTLARLLNMSRAADELRMTPSGVSHCLKALEHDLGCRLFERTSRKVVLSRAGRDVLNEAEEILRRMAALRDTASARSVERQRELRIGASATACQFVLPHALREFRESFPDFTVQIEPCSSRQAVALLNDAKLDFALVVEPAQTAGLEFEFLAEDDLQFIVHPLHPWAVKRRAVREDIAQRKLIVPARRGDTFAMIERYFRDEGISIQPFIEIASEESIKHFVEVDMGVGILPAWMAATEIEEGVLVTLPLGRRKLKRRWGVLHAPGRKQRFAESLLVDLCRGVLRGLVAMPDGE